MAFGQIKVRIYGLLQKLAINRNNYIYVLKIHTSEKLHRYIS